MAVITINTMKTLYNLLSQDVIDMAHREVEELKNEYVWKVSLNFWYKELVEGAVVGSVSQTLVSPRLADIITSTITPYIPPYNDLMIQHYLWHPLSGINMHDDRGYLFGATIYLTPVWDVTWGGLFVYEDKNGPQVTYPTYNSININDDSTMHMVTMVSPLAPHPRHTLQIWAK